VAKLDGSMPVYDLKTLEDQLDEDVEHRAAYRVVISGVWRACDGAGRARDLWRHGIHGGAAN
jgi:hypothetical protein